MIPEMMIVKHLMIYNFVYIFLIRFKMNFLRARLLPQLGRYETFHFFLQKIVKKQYFDQIIQQLAGMFVQPPSAFV